MIEEREKKLANGFVVLAGILTASLFYVLAGLGIAAAALLSGIVYWRWRLVPRQGLRGTKYLCVSLLTGIVSGAILGFGIAAFCAGVLHLQMRHGGTAVVLFFSILSGFVVGGIIGFIKLWQPADPPEGAPRNA
jgi:hypothetical protein